ncbi:acyl-CoA dehydrogenase/oxidase [Phakopsora pachyrhizi]|nr:acyl-CoA dehydrogenase/oxidase [Phakopsora pachyrhizi]
MTRHEPFGNQLTPFSEPSWYNGLPSPYYNESHIKLRKIAREWTETHLVDQAHDWEENGSIDHKTYERAAQDGLILPNLGGLRIPKEWTRHGKIIGDIPADQWDGFHAFILQDELSRCGSAGAVGGLFSGLAYGGPLVWKYGSDFLRNSVVPSILDGSKRICIAITEPNAGSDVKNLSTTAEKSSDGKFWIINGITNGIWCDYFSTAVRTKGSAGDPSGISVIVIPKGPGVKVSRLKMGGVWSSGTSQVVFDNVKVPIEYLVGVENKGFEYIMSNFNHERMNIAFSAHRSARICIEDAFKHSQKRKVFGKPLIELSVIRHKLGQMVRMVESQQAWIESLIYQLNNLSGKEGSALLGGQSALLKAHCGITLEYVAREAVQIMGGLGYTRGGEGERIERIWREIKSVSIPGGSEEVMLDLAVRQQIKISAKSKQNRRISNKL